MFRWSYFIFKFSLVLIVFWVHTSQFRWWIQFMYTHVKLQIVKQVLRRQFKSLFASLFCTLWSQCSKLRTCSTPKPAPKLMFVHGSELQKFATLPGHLSPMTFALFRRAHQSTHICWLRPRQTKYRCADLCHHQSHSHLCSAQCLCKHPSGRDSCNLG